MMSAYLGSQKMSEHKSNTSIKLQQLSSKNMGFNT